MSTEEGKVRDARDLFGPTEESMKLFVSERLTLSGKEIVARDVQAFRVVKDNANAVTRLFGELLSLKKDVKEGVKTSKFDVAKFSQVPRDFDSKLTGIGIFWKVFRNFLEGYAVDSELMRESLNQLKDVVKDNLSDAVYLTNKIKDLVGDIENALNDKDDLALANHVTWLEQDVFKLLKLLPSLAINPKVVGALEERLEEVLPQHQEEPKLKSA